MDSDAISRFKYSITHRFINRRRSVKTRFNHLKTGNTDCVVEALNPLKTEETFVHYFQLFFNRDRKILRKYFLISGCRGSLTSDCVNM